MIRASVVGATGYVGHELVRLLSRHPGVELVALTSESYAGREISEVYPDLGPYAGSVCRKLELEEIARDSDVVFLALHHGMSHSLVPAILEQGKKVIDMSADFRFRRASLYEEWYGQVHPSPELSAKAVYGLPELHREEIRQAPLVANPGCYPTSALLAAAPLVKGGLVDGDRVIIDAKSGVSGAGRGLSLRVHYAEVNENLQAYSIAGSHRHTAEIEQELGLLAGKEIRVCFTPHLIPMTRGILSTVYLDLKLPLSTGEAVELYRGFYREEPFVRVLDPGELPQTKHVYGSNFCHLGIQVDHRTGRVLVVSVIDNLVKGAAGQAVQNMNLLFGLPEETGLAHPGIFP